MLSSFAISFNLHRYAQDITGWSTPALSTSTSVERCRLTVSRSVLKAPTVAALETIIYIINCFQRLHSNSTCAATLRGTCSPAPPRGWPSSRASTKAGRSKGRPRAGSSKHNTLQVPVLSVARGYIRSPIQAFALAPDIRGRFERCE